MPWNYNTMCNCVDIIDEGLWGRHVCDVCLGVGDGAVSGRERTVGVKGRERNMGAPIGPSGGVKAGGPIARIRRVKGGGKSQCRGQEESLTPCIT
jgi:hypothetical protein